MPSSSSLLSLCVVVVLLPWLLALVSSSQPLMCQIPSSCAARLGVFSGDSTQSVPLLGSTSYLSAQYTALSSGDIDTIFLAVVSSTPGSTIQVQIQEYVALGAGFIGPVGSTKAVTLSGGAQYVALPIVGGFFNVQAGFDGVTYYVKVFGVRGDGIYSPLSRCRTIARQLTSHTSLTPCLPLSLCVISAVLSCDGAEWPSWRDCDDHCDSGVQLTVWPDRGGWRPMQLHRPMPLRLQLHPHVQARL